MDQVEELLFTGTVKRRVSLLIEAIKLYYEDVPAAATEVEAWRAFLGHAVQDRGLWCRLAPALVIADAIRGLDRTVGLLLKIHTNRVTILADEDGKQ
jgi:hypothetical protein